MCRNWGLETFWGKKLPQKGYTRLISTTVALRHPCSPTVDAYLRSKAYVYNAF